jgi:hypothetical protein
MRIVHGQAQRKRRDRTLGVVATLGIGTALIYKLVWPRTSLRADLVFSASLWPGFLRCHG